MSNLEVEKAKLLLTFLKEFEIKPTNKNLTELEKVVPCIKNVHRNISKDNNQPKLF